MRTPFERRARIRRGAERRRDVLAQEPLTRARGDLCHAVTRTRAEDYNSHMKLYRAAVLVFAAAAAAAAAVATPARAQTPAPTPDRPSLAPSPAEEHVVAPSLPDQPNKEGVARPSGSMPTDSEGYVRTNRGAVDPSAPTPSAAGATPGASPAAGPGIAVPAAQAPSGPTGPAEVKAAYLSLRGTVKRFEKGVSVTIVEKAGVERTVALAKDAFVYGGLAAGDKVVLRIPLRAPSNGMSADRVTKARRPKAPRKSKFSAAESPVR